MYALPEEMWLEWLKDEMNLGGNDYHKQIVALFDTALADYHYRKVYKLYLRYLIGRKEQEEGD